MYNIFKTSTNYTTEEKMYKDINFVLPKNTRLIPMTREKYTDTSTLASFSDELFNSTSTNNYM